MKKISTLCRVEMFFQISHRYKSGYYIRNRMTKQLCWLLTGGFVSKIMIAGFVREGGIRIIWV